jgi:hypothetical protein
VAIADSHYISKSLGSRVLGAYYLGCPMTDNVRRGLQSLLAQHHSDESTLIEKVMKN